MALRVSGLESRPRSTFDTVAADTPASAANLVDRQRRQRYILVDEVDVAMALADLHNAPENPLQTPILRVRLDVGICASRIEGFVERRPDPWQERRLPIELRAVALGFDAFQVLSVLSGTSSPPMLQDGLGIDGVMSR